MIYKLITFIPAYSFWAIFAHVSFSVTVLLNTSLPLADSLSTQKYPNLSCFVHWDTQILDFHIQKPGLHFGRLQNFSFHLP
jgi:hypothetical protein